MAGWGFLQRRGPTIIRTKTYAKFRSPKPQRRRPISFVKEMWMIGCACLCLEPMVRPTSAFKIVLKSLPKRLPRTHGAACCHRKFILVMSEATVIGQSGSPERLNGPVMNPSLKPGTTDTERISSYGSIGPGRKRTTVDCDDVPQYTGSNKKLQLMLHICLERF